MLYLAVFWSIISAKYDNFLCYLAVINMKPFQPIESKAFILRSEEKKFLADIEDAKDSAIIIVHGRRRVGKTELLEQYFRKRNILKFEGLEGKDQQKQREHVLYQLSQYAQDNLLAKLQVSTWVEVFELIFRYVSKGKWTVYFEEVQWLADYKDEFASDLKYVWDNHFRHNKQLLLILCGSSPSFMIQHIARSKALYNRSQYELPLSEFNLIESKDFLKKQSLSEALDAYLILGGIPEYLNKINRGSSVFLNVCEQSFKPGGFLFTEYDKIFVSSLASNVFFKSIIDFLSQRKFATRPEIAKHLGAKSGGTLSEVLADLEMCGFIERYMPYNAKPDSILIRYCIRDAYLNFYFKFIKPQRKAVESGDYVKQPSRAIKHEAYRRWMGLAFEKFCRRNHLLIANILRFSGVNYHAGAFFNRATAAIDSGYQIDLLYDRDDHVYTVCEIKYTQAPVTSEVITEFERKLSLIPNRDKKTIHKVLISVNGASQPVLDSGYFDHIITLKELFDTSNW
jgi:AAA+ ATPase superfamily predicted ATPase